MVGKEEKPEKSGYSEVKVSDLLMLLPSEHDGDEELRETRTKGHPNNKNDIFMRKYKKYSLKKREMIIFANKKFPTIQ